MSIAEIAALELERASRRPKCPIPDWYAELSLADIDGINLLLAKFRPITVIRKLRAAGFSTPSAESLTAHSDGVCSCHEK